jgi:chemotaxis protein methyltransferase WspC
MNLTAVAEHLQQRIGLDPEALGPTVLPSAVKARMRQLSLGDANDYARRLGSDVEEFQALVSELIVPETWFFRGGPVFPYLTAHVSRAVRQRSGGRPFRVLSVPCSTGEEPYSLAIALHQAGVSGTACTILGVDLSARLVERARQGCYSEFSFRQVGPEVRRQFFRRVKNGWELDPVLRGAVQFQQGNLLDPFFLAGEGAFDLIFCRNVLIYLLPAARQHVRATLERLLTPDGLLCVGHAEPLDLSDGRFERLGDERLFLYRRCSPSPPPGRLIVPRPLTMPSPAERRRGGGGRGREIRNRAGEPRPGSGTENGKDERFAEPPDLLAQARQQADNGQLDEALAGCRLLLTRQGPSAELYSLLGVVHQARREPDEALRCFRKALYLQADHPEALLHLMLLYQEQGDRSQAASLRQRIQGTAPGGEA